jgi:hypothetical protein
MFSDITSIQIGTGIFSSLMFLYTDPGTGTLILQLLAAGAIGAVFYLRVFARRAKSFFTRKQETEAGADDSSTHKVELNESPSDLTKKVE